MALASEADVEAALRRELTEAEDVSTLIEVASDLACAELGYRPGLSDPVVVDGVAARVVAMMVAAVLTKPATNTADYGANGYNVVRESMPIKVGVESATTTGPWMTKTLRKILEPYGRRGRGAFSIDLAPEVVEGS